MVAVADTSLTVSRSPSWRADNSPSMASATVNAASPEAVGRGSGARWRGRWWRGRRKGSGCGASARRGVPTVKEVDPHGQDLEKVQYERWPSKGRLRSPTIGVSHTRNGLLLNDELHPKLVIQEGDVVGRLVDTDRQSAAYAVASSPIDGKIDRPARCGRRLQASDHLA
jgi:hypothetical protein